MLRIVGGKFGGRKLTPILTSLDLRPTTDKSREALFNILSSGALTQKIGLESFKIEDAKMLDLCCGSGAVGLEAISRGVGFVSFVDSNRLHIKILQQNLDLLGIASNQSQFEIINLDVKKFTNQKQKYDLVFIDPPYKSDYFELILCVLKNCQFSKNCLFVIEFDDSLLQNIAIRNCLVSRFDELDLRRFQDSEARRIKTYGKRESEENTAKMTTKDRDNKQFLSGSKNQRLKILTSKSEEIGLKLVEFRSYGRCYFGFFVVN